MSCPRTLGGDFSGTPGTAVSLMGGSEACNFSVVVATKSSSRRSLVTLTGGFGVVAFLPLVLPVVCLVLVPADPGVIICTLSSLLLASALLLLLEVLLLCNFFSVDKSSFSAFLGSFRTASNCWINFCKSSSDKLLSRLALDGVVFTTGVM